MIVADTNISVDLLDTENNMVVGDVNIKDETERVLPTVADVRAWQNEYR